MTLTDHSPGVLALGAVALLVTAVGFLLAGIRGLLPLALVLAFLLASPLSAFAIGQVGAAALTLPTTAFALVQAGLFGLLLAAGLAIHRRVVLGLALATPLLLGVAWAGTAWGGATWVGGLALVATTAVASYGIHRYERLTLGLLESHQ